MAWLKFRHIFTALFFLLCLNSCLSNLGTGVKTLGSATVGSTYNPTADADPFALVFAFMPAGSNVASIQGSTATGAAQISSICGQTGSNCTCTFYQTTTNTNTTGSASVSASLANNSINCTINVPTGLSASNYTYVVLSALSGTQSTGQVSLQTTLTIQNVLGGLPVNNVRGIYRYQCMQSYVEGNTVVPPTGITCSAGLNLGFLTGNWYYYLFNSQLGSNLNTQTQSIPFNAGITGTAPGMCGYQGVLQDYCPGSPTLIYALYGVASGPFTVPVNLSPNPTIAASTVGYAAVTDNAGNCPTGLVKIRPYFAQPASILQGSIDNYNPPSTFLNTNGNLNGTMVEVVPASGVLPQTFQVTRYPNRTQACNATPGCNTPDASLFPAITTPLTQPVGACSVINAITTPITYYDCSQITLLSGRVVQTVAYVPSTPIVCAIPANLVTGLF